MIELLSACVARVPYAAAHVGEFSQILERPPHTIAVVANAYDSGFSTRWPRGSSILIAEVCGNWDATGGTVAARLRETFYEAASAFIDEARTLLKPASPEEEPAASLMVAVVERGVVHLAWVGEGCAVHARAGGVVARAKPHTLGARRPGDAPEALRDTLARLIDSRHAYSVSEKLFVLEPGDRFAMSNRPRDYATWPAEAARALETRPNVVGAARALVGDEFLSKHGAAAVCVLGLDRAAP